MRVFAFGDGTTAGREARPQGNGSDALGGPARTPEGDIWVDGAAYEAYVGRWSRLVAADFLKWLGLPTGKRWLDVGCGTGSLTSAILERCDPSEVVGVDPSTEYVAYAASRVAEVRAWFEVAEATKLPEGPFDAVVSALTLNFVPDPGLALRAMGAVAPGGTVAAYVWDYAEGMRMLRYFWDAAVSLDKGAQDWDEGGRFSVCRPDRLEGAWRGAGFVQVASRPIDVPTVFHDFDDYWQPFLRGDGPAPAYVASLSRERQVALGERIRERLPEARDGSISLTARAWAIRGRALSAS